MPIDLYSTVKKTSHWAFANNFINKTLGSSIFVALSIALLMILIIMFMYPAKAGTPFYIVMKMFVYMFFGSLLIVFLHDGVIKYLFEEEHQEKRNEVFMQNTTAEGRDFDPVYSTNYKPIKPNLPGSISGGYQQSNQLNTAIPPQASNIPVSPDEFDEIDALLNTKAPTEKQNMFK